jgi:hypothetical protein
MTRIAALIATALWLAACAAPVEEVGQCEPGVDQIATQAGSVLCPS